MRHSMMNRAASLLVTVTTIWGGPALANQAPALTTQLADMTGTNLTGTECAQRMQALSAALEQAGYGPVRMLAFTDGTVIARWYHPESHRTVLVFTGTKMTGNAFEPSEFAGLQRFNEFRGGP